MFERYTEKARRVIFFARYEASQFGSPYIETEHLLLGLLREDTDFALHVLKSDEAIAAIRKELEARPHAEKTSTSVDLPLSHPSKRVLAYGAEEAERLRHKHIGTGHLLLGLLREEEGVAAQMLAAHGVRLADAREMVKEAPPVTQRQQLHELVDQIPQDRWADALKLLRGLTDPSPSRTMVWDAPLDPPPEIDRFTAKAHRALFFARYEASQFGSPHIESEHLLLGLLREDHTLAYRFLHSHAAVESIRKQIEAQTAIREKVSTSVDLPLTEECKAVVDCAGQEAEALGHKHVGTEHLLLGMLCQPQCFAARLLGERGVDLETVRNELRRSS